MHYCPECGQACFCHGDLDDCVVETEAYSSRHCTHPERCEAERDREYDGEYGLRDDEEDEL